ncbi:uncharacterized protein LOC142523736 [Primulina tabacum]|uniref:uncharacterized protein LOC142523736 n=1 Tax=Primulina tabacum TaxID=48773 RepID=UPI003F5A550B
MRQRRLIELLKDYDITINYHPGKANKVANALSRRDVGKVNLSALSAQPCLQETIKLKQNHDPSIAKKIKEQLQEGKAQEFQTDEKGVLWMKGRLPKSRQNHDGIWVIIDRLTKSAHFLPMRMKYNLDKLATLYMDNIVSNGVPASLLSDKDPRLALPPDMSRIHDVFHVSQLRKYIFDPIHILETGPLLVEGNLNEELKYE